MEQQEEKYNKELKDLLEQLENKLFNINMKRREFYEPREKD